MLASPENDRKTNRFNDAEMRSRRTFVAGTLERWSAKSTCRPLLRGKSGKLAKPCVSGITLSMASPGAPMGERLYHVGFAGLSNFCSFPTISPPVRSGRGGWWSRFPANLGIPDGMDIDVEGNPGLPSGAVQPCVVGPPSPGRFLAEISVPCSPAQLLLFLAAGLDRLFSHLGSRGPETRGPCGATSLAGGVFVCDPGTSGGRGSSVSRHDRFHSNDQ